MRHVRSGLKLARKIFIIRCHIYRCLLSGYQDELPIEPGVMPLTSLHTLRAPLP